VAGFQLVSKTFYKDRGRGPKGKAAPDRRWAGSEEGRDLLVKQVGQGAQQARAATRSSAISPFASGW